MSIKQAVSSKPRLAVVVSGARLEGAVARVALEQAAMLAKRFDVTVFSDCPPDEAWDLKFRRIRAWKLNYLRRFGHVVRAILFARSCARALCAADRTLPLQFVWCHGHGEACHAARVGFAGKLGMTVHGDIFSRPPGTYDPLLTYWYRRVSPRAYRECRIVHVLSDAGREAAIRRGAEPSKCLILPNGIRPSDFGETAQTARSAGKGILYVGRISPEKGLGDLLAAMNTSRLAGAQLVVAGHGVLMEQCRSMAQDLGIQARFLGWVSRATLREHYLQANVLCCPSLDEAFPTVVLEAMAFGLPVVATSVGGIPSLVHNGKTGLLCKPSRPDLLASALADILEDPARAHAMGMLGRERVLHEFSWERICRRLGERIAEAMG